MEAKAKAKVEKKAEAFVEGEAPKSVITLTEMPGGTGGFSIAVGLHGARMEELFPGVAHPVSIVDVMALALTHLIRTESPDLKAAVAKVNATLSRVSEAINDGRPAEEAAVEAIADLDTPTAPAPAEPETTADVD